ncbi:MAG: gluconate 2-dehydrogenase subunit 3 family protein [Flavobacteriaceae bacterium]
MQRRTALKKIGLTFGALTLTPTVASLIQSCQSTEKGWSPTFLSSEQAPFVGQILEVMLPSTQAVPGAKELNLIRFIDSFLATATNAENQEIFQLGLDLFTGITQTAVGQTISTEITSEAIDSQLAYFLRASDEKQAQWQRAFTDFTAAAREGVSETPPLEGISHHFLVNLRNLAVKAFKTNEIIAKEHLIYAPVPGEQLGCVDLQEATAGKAWAL